VRLALEEQGVAVGFAGLVVAAVAAVAEPVVVVLAVEEVEQQLEAEVVGED
jgi:hypothetical protein